MKINLNHEARKLPLAWKSAITGRAAEANIKVVRMDTASYPDEVHEFSEGLLVLEGQMNLQIEGEIVAVTAGEIFIVPAGVPHAVAPGSHGTLIIVDR